MQYTKTKQLIGSKKMQNPTNDDMHILWNCLIYGGLGSVAGIAAQLRTQQPLTKVSFISALLNSAMFSIAIGYFILWKYGEQNYILTLVLSILSGLGGTSLLDFCFGLFKIYLKKKINEDTSDSERGK